MKFCVVFLYEGRERTTESMWSEQADEFISRWEWHNRKMVEQGKEPYVTNLRKVPVAYIGCPSPS